MSERRETWLVAALAVVPLLPFLNAAVSIDAPVFLAVARQILVAPLDPFGFDMIWDPTSPHAAEFNQNPPLLSYWLAPWIAAFGEWEPALHVALLPFPLLAALSFLGIARRVSVPGLPASALLLATPAFLVLATTMMLDVPMLACLLLAVYALLRANASPSTCWQLAAGAAAAAAGLMKYAGLASLPLLAAGLVLLPPAGSGRLAAAVRVLGIPALAWGLWALATTHLYGAPHFAGGLMLVGERSFDPAEFWNQILSIPIYYGGALLFPIGVALASARRQGPATVWALVGVMVGGVATTWVLPGGEPPRRVPLGHDLAIFAAIASGGAFAVWGTALRPGRVLAAPVDRFLALWLVGFAVFTALVNWHVNAADALIAAPPAILLWMREARPSRRFALALAALVLPCALALTWADTRQREVYRSLADRMAREIGSQGGARWFVGHWGLQYYLEREGFRPVVPPQYERSYGRSELAKGDWVASARNVSQLDVSRHMARFGIRPVWTWSEPASWPLRTTNPDAGAGFYSHHAGYVPFAWSDAPLEQAGLGRVVSVRGP